MTLKSFQPFEWDEDKNAINKQKHGIGFEQAKSIFDGVVLEAIEPLSLAYYGEERIKATGLLNEAETVVVFTYRGSKRRLISARRAKRDEREQYWQHSAGDD